MSKTLALALKQIRQAANNLHMEAEDGGQQEEHRSTVRLGRLLLEQIANAIEHGPAYITTVRAEAFDTENQKRQ